MDIFPFEVTAMGVTGILLLFNILTPEEAISGFSNKAVIIIGAIFIISRSLVKTGFLEVLADYMYQWGGQKKMAYHYYIFAHRLHHFRVYQ